MTKRIRPNAINEDRYRSPTASVNSFASDAEIVVPGCRIEALMLCALPMTKVTAIVSPRARPRPSMVPPTMPALEYGTTTCQMTSQVVAPSPYADSFNTSGTVSNTSRITADMNGMTMTASTIPAVSTPIPKGGPWKSAPTPGIAPRVSMIQGCAYCCRIGAKTNRPQTPKMMLGTAASSSIATPTGRLSQAGASSVRKIAMPKLIGTANSIEMIEVMIVP